MVYIKSLICIVTGFFGSLIAGMYGGWTSAMTTLILFMAIDYITGLIVAGVFHKSTKTKSGALESKAGFKGLCRKGVILLIVAVAYRLDLMMGAAYIQDAVIIAFVVNETISIIENAGLMGIPIPDKLRMAIELLQGKKEKE